MKKDDGISILLSVVINIIIIFLIPNLSANKVENKKIKIGLVAYENKNRTKLEGEKNTNSTQKKATEELKKTPPKKEAQKVEKTVEKKKEEKRQQEEKIKSQELKKVLEAKKVEMAVKTGENGKLFGAITNKEVAVALEQTFGVKIDRKKIECNIKSLGEHIAVIKLHTDVKAEVKIVTKAQ